jgi:hypothetical protein
MIRRLVNRVFRLEKINGHEMCPTYLYRWTLLKLGSYGIYLHHFVGDDWSHDLHDHPKRFVSIGLKGRYTEETPSGTREFRAPWIRSFPAEHIHRISLRPGEDCWTLVFVLKNVRKWGFWHRGSWIPWRTYVGSEKAQSRKACP